MAILSVMAHRAFKDRLYPQFARIGQALASDKRLEVIDLLAQAPRHVDALASETGQSLANISQHLQILRAARLVETERRGTRVFYRLASDSVTRLWLSLRSAGEELLPEIDLLSREFLADRRTAPTVSRSDLEEMSAGGRSFVLDVRPAIEFEAGHLPGAANIPVEELAGRLAELPRDRLIVTYCRGEYCVFADEAVALLMGNGFQVARLEGGWPEWTAEGREVDRPEEAYP